jgi:G3E family GTPase
MSGFDITKVQSKSATFELPEIQAKKIIPAFGSASSVIIVGASGSGKTTLLTQLVSDKRFYGDFFKPKNRYLFSETAGLDSLAKELGVPKDNIHESSDDKEIIEILDTFIENKKKDMANEEPQKVLLIFEDFSSRDKVMRSKAFKFLFTAGRHIHVMNIVMVHKITALNRICRLNCLFWFIFKTNVSELDRLASEHLPAHMTKKQFIHMVQEATKEPHSFITIMGNDSDEETKYRKNLTHYITMPK